MAADLAVAGVRRPENYRELHHLLRVWRLRAVAYSDSGYAARLLAVQDPARAGRRARLSHRVTPATPTRRVTPASDWGSLPTAGGGRFSPATASGPA
jgi:hypothetical protein